MPAPFPGDAAGDCPQAEALSAFVDRRLPEDERQQVAEHVSRCDACHDVVRETALILAAGDLAGADDAAGEAPARSPRWGHLNRWGSLAAAILAVAGAATLSQRQGWFLSPSERASRELVRAVGPHRLIEPRLTGGFLFGPPVSTKRAAGTEEDYDLLHAVAAASARYRANPTPENTRALAAAHLFMGRPDAGVDLLQALVRSQPNDALAWNDLAAARLVRAERQGEARDLKDAVEAATRALELQPELHEALYNLALALHRLHLSAPAREACRRLLESDRSAWRPAAQELLEAIDARSRSSAGETVEAARLDFEAHLERLAGPDDVAVLASQGARFRERTRDRSIEAVAGELRQLPGAMSSYVSYAVARRDYVERRWTKARAGFTRALPTLAGQRSALAPWARLHLSILDYQQGGAKAVEGAFEPLLAQAEGQPLLEARLRWMLGLCAVARGRFDDADQHFGRAKDLFSDSGDLAHASFMSLERSEVLDYLGRHDLAWSERLVALGGLESFPDFRRKITLLHAAAARATDSDAPRAALAFIAQARDVLRSQSGGEDAELGLEQARAELALGLPQSEATLFEQESRIQQERDVIRRERLLGEFYRVASDFPDSQPGTRIREAMNRGIAWMAARAESAREAPLLVQRGRSSLRAGDRVSSRSDFERAVRLLATESESDFEMRLSRMALGGEALERLVEIGAAEGTNESDLLALADRRWQLSAEGAIGGMSIEGIQRLVSRLRAQVAVVGILPLESQTLSWCVTSDGVVRKWVPVSRNELARLAHRDEVGLLLQFLAPHADQLQSRDRLLVVASGPLARARWGKLQSRDARAIPQAIALVPSLQYVLEHGDVPYDPPTNVLAVAAAGTGQLPFLARVQGEAEGVVRALGTGRFVRGSQLEEGALLSDLRQVSAFHFAGHAVANPERPSWSRLVMAPEGEDVLVRDIREQDLRNLRVVTLSACSAAADQSTFGGGGLSLAAAFLRAGATTVIAPLDDMRDDDAPAMMAELYARLAHQDPVRALAEMQGTHDESDPTSALVVFTAAGALSNAPRHAANRKEHGEEP